MQRLSMVLCILLQTICQAQEDAVQLLAEWEPTSHIWIQWDEGSSMGSEPIEHTLVELIASITPHHEVRILVANQKLMENARKMLKEHELDSSRITFTPIHAYAAITDPSPVFIRDKDGHFGTIDFRWNNYGVREVGHPKTISTDTFDRAMAHILELPVRAKSDLVWEGGAMDHNGHGTMLFSEQWMKQRNPAWSKAEVEQELADKLCIRQIIWLQKGPAEDDFQRVFDEDIYPFGTGGHIDEFCRFANDSTILIAMGETRDTAGNIIEKETFERMQINYEILQKATDPDGKKFHIVPVPIPDLLVRRIPSSYILPGDAAWFPGYESKDSVRLVLATSYLNFLLTDKLVIGAKYWKPGLPMSMQKKDKQIKQILTKLFPKRTIVMLNPETLNHHGGGIHCYTYNEPQRKTTPP